MKVLVIGSGGREHALVMRLKQSRKVDKIFCAPGNGGISKIARCVNIKATKTRMLAEFAQKNKIGLTVVGPEQPLAMGIVDEFRRRKLRIFGPDAKGAQLESSKIFAKNLMRKYHIPTASYRPFTIAAEAMGFCRSAKYPMVIKADGLAAGKGVIIAHDFDQATAAIEDMMLKRKFGSAGDRIMIEAFLEGQELSVMALTDGKTVLPLLSSQDHKQAFDGDRGPNTGGMGAYSPTSIATPELMDTIFERILSPLVVGLGKEGIVYKGVIYAGVMLCDDGPRVLEFNCRFGDPETQVVLPLLKSDFFDLLMAVTRRELARFGDLSWRRETAACVTMASKGYPGDYKTGIEITRLPDRNERDKLVFHAGTSVKGNRWYTSGGRVFSVVGIDRDLKSALGKTYQMVNRIKFDGAMYRKDIGFRVLQNNERTN